MASGEIYQGDNEGLNLHLGSKDHNLWSLIKRTLFIVGSASVVFVALRNSLTYHLQQFWGASGSFWQQRWDNILDVLGDDPFNLLVIGPTLAGYSVFLSIGLLYTLMDMTGRPKFLRKYKVQPGTNEPVEKWKLLKAIAIIHFNIAVVSPLMSYIFYHLIQLRGYNQSRELPTFQWVLFEMIIFILIEEAGFYYSHRVFHHRLLYKHFHKLHHEWQSPIAITAVYAHPLEHVIANLTPILLGPFIMGSHPATAWLWYCLAVLSTLNAHSGYHLPFLPSPEAHDYHHLKFNECYGVLGILDLLHGTDEKFRMTNAFSRHIMMLTLTPPREAYPDEQDPKAKNGKGKVC